MDKNCPYLGIFKENSICRIAPSADKYQSDLEPTLNDLSMQIAIFEPKPINEVVDKTNCHEIVTVYHSKIPSCDLQDATERGLCTDIIVRVHNREFQCHSIILGIYAKRLRPYLQRSVINISSNQLTPRGFSLVYQWMISKYGTINATDVADLLKAATFVDVPELIEQCWITLDDRVFNEFGSFDLLYQIRKTKGLSYLNEQMALRISKSFLTIVSSSEYIELNESQMCTLLSSSKLAVNSEVEVLFSAFLWLNHNWPMRQASVGPILKNIRFGYLAPTILSKFKTIERYNIGPFGHILDVFCTLPEMPKLVQDGLFYSSLIITSYNDPDFLMESVQHSNLRMAAPRRWMHDGRCFYHRPICRTCPNMRHLKFEDFSNYLIQLQAVDWDFDSQMTFNNSVEFYDWHHEFASSPVLSIDLYKKHVENYGSPLIPSGHDNLIDLELQEVMHWDQVLVCGYKWHTNSSENDDELLKMVDVLNLLNKTLKEEGKTEVSETSLTYGEKVELNEPKKMIKTKKN